MNALLDSVTFGADHIAPLLITWSWQALLLLPVAPLVIRLTRAKSPALRHQIWLVALLALALLPLGTIAIRQFPQLHTRNATINYVVRAPGTLVAGENTTTPAGSDESRRANAAKPTPSDWARSAIRGFNLIVVTLWITGALFLVAGLCAVHIKWKRVVRTARGVSRTDAPGLGLERLGGRRVSIRLSPEISSPLLYGLFRPTILLPEDIADWTTLEERAAMIDHELAHIDRRDALSNLLQTALRTLFFFHPFVRYACRQMSLERELACDDRVLRHGGSAEVYAQGILKVAERSLRTPSIHQLAFFSARRTLERRVEMILDRDRVRSINLQMKPLVFSMTVLTLGAWLLIPGSSAMTTRARASEVTQGKVNSGGERKALDRLIEMALRNPDPRLRAQVLAQILAFERERDAAALFQLYGLTGDREIKRRLIVSLWNLSEIGHLVSIVDSESSAPLRRHALWGIKHLKQHSDDARVRAWDTSAIDQELERLDVPPPPPPPPPKPTRGTKPPPPPPPPPAPKTG